MKKNKEFNNNLVVWQVFIWLFGKFSLGYLVSIHLVIWQVFIWLFGKFLFGYLAKFRLLSLIVISFLRACERTNNFILCIK
jgi:hypothetical protein